MEKHADVHSSKSGRKTKRQGESHHLQVCLFLAFPAQLGRSVQNQTLCWAALQATILTAPEEAVAGLAAGSTAQICCG